MYSSKRCSCEWKPAGGKQPLDSRPLEPHLVKPMDLVTVKIPARSRRQAMEWSLVLASQGIECTLAAPEPPDGWGLIVPSVDYSRASEALQLYQMENRHWRWRHQL